MKRIPYFLIIHLAFTACSSNVRPSVEVAVDYERGLARLKAGATNQDYRKLRLDYAEQPEFDPYGRSEEVRAGWADYGSGQFAQAAARADEGLKADYLNIGLQMLAALSAHKLGEDEKAALHTRIADGLLNSVCSGKSGASPEESCTVISVDEEYAYLRSRDLEAVEQSVIKQGAQSYDLLQVRDREGRIFPLYFNVDIPWRFLQRRLISPM